VFAAVAFVTLAVLGGAAGFLSEVFESSVVRSTELSSTVSALTVHNTQGDVRLSPSPDHVVHVVTEIRRGLEEPVTTETSDADGVVLSAECGTEGFGATCSVDYTVQVPPAYAVRVQVGSGQVSARGLTGGVTVDVEHGSVALHDLAGPVDVRSDSGEVRAIGLSSPMVAVDTSSGDVQLYLRTPPDAVQARTDHGSVDIRLPGTTTYRVSADAGDGIEWIGVRNDPASPHAVVATTGTGHIQIGTRPDAPVVVPVPPKPPVPPAAPAPR
jgi:hypothetical protein